MFFSKKNLSIFFCVSFFIFENGFAQSSVKNDSASENLMKESLGDFSNKKNNLKTSVDYELTKYFNEIPDNPRLSQSQLVTAGVDYQIRGRRWNKKVQFIALSYVDWGTSQLGLNELYTETFWDHSSLSFGRKKEYWSGIDHAWKLSMWQPLFNSNPLIPEEQGLTGFFYNKEYDDSDFMVFATPIFIPTMGPEIKEKNNALVSESRWFQSPSSSYSLFNKDIKIYYSLENVRMEELILKPGFALRYRVNPNKAGTYFNMQLGRKPINALSLRYERFLLAKDQSNQDGVAVVGPVVSYHRLGGVDFGYRTEEKDLFEISLLFENPEKALPDRTGESNRIQWLQQQPQPMAAFNLGYETYYSLEVDKDLRVRADLLKLQVGQTVDADAAGNTQPSLFPHRTSFTSALSLGGDYTTRVFQSLLNVSLKWIREFDQQGDIVSLTSQWNQKNWFLKFGLDVLAVDQPQNNTDDRFINKFRGNDRISAGLGYVF